MEETIFLFVFNDIKITGFLLKPAVVLNIASLSDNLHL